MSPESILTFYNNSIKNGVGFYIKDIPPLKWGESILCNPSGAIRFYRRESSGTYILFYGDDKISFWSDFAEKDSSAQRISDAKYGCNVSFGEFMDDMRLHMPNHFEWMLWNFV